MQRPAVLPLTTIALKYSLFLSIWFPFYGKILQFFVVKIEEFCATFLKLYLRENCFCLHNSRLFNFLHCIKTRQKKRRKKLSKKPFNDKVREL